MGTRKLDLKEAAAALGITSEAVRRRAKRGTLPSENGEDGRLYVWLSDEEHLGVHGVSDGEVHGGPHAGESEVLLERVEDENEFLRQELERLHRELERKDAILMSLVQRVPELEPAKETSPEPREPPETASGSGERAEVSPYKENRSWWQRLFG